MGAIALFIYPKPPLLKNPSRQDGNGLRHILMSGGAFFIRPLVGHRPHACKVTVELLGKFSQCFHVARARGAGNGAELHE